MGQIIGNLGQANNYKAQASVALAQGRAQKAAANKQAFNLEEEARTDSVLAGKNMMRQRENQTAAQATVRNAAASSGFSSQGSGQQSEIAAADIFETAIRDMALSNAISDSNKRYAADVSRFQGNLAMQQAEAAASQYNSLAKTAKTSAWLQLGSTVAGVGGALLNNVGQKAKIQNLDDKGIPVKGEDGKIEMIPNPKYLDPTAYAKSIYDLSGSGLQFAPGSVGASRDSMDNSTSYIYELFSKLFPEGSPAQKKP